MSRDEIIKNLRQKLQINFEEYMRRLNAMAPPDLIDQAMEIAVAKVVYRESMKDVIFETLPAELLEQMLELDSPLAVISDRAMHHITDSERNAAYRRNQRLDINVLVAIETVGTEIKQTERLAEQLGQSSRLAQSM